MKRTKVIALTITAKATIMRRAVEIKTSEVYKS